MHLQDKITQPLHDSKPQISDALKLERVQPGGIHSPFIKIPININEVSQIIKEIHLLPE